MSVLPSAVKPTCVAIVEESVRSRIHDIMSSEGVGAWV